MSDSKFGRHAIFYAREDNVVLMKQCLDLANSMKYRERYVSRALHAAADANHIECVRALLEYPQNIDWQNDKKKTALTVACRRNNHEIAEMLLRHGADPNISGHHRRTSLTTAIDNDATECIDLLLDRNVDIRLDYAPAHAARKGNVDALRKMTTKYPFDHLGFSYRSSQLNPMMTAVLRCRLTALQFILNFLESKKKLELVNARDSYEQTPVMLIPNQPDSVNCLRMLLKYGADVNLTDDGGNALNYALSLGQNDEYLDILIKLTDFEKLRALKRQGGILNLAVQRGNLELVRMLINKNFDPDNIFTSSRPITLAVCNGDEKMTDLLIRAGSNVVKAGWSDGFAIWDSLFASGNARMALKLIFAGLDVRYFPNYDRFQAIFYSCSRVTWNVIEIFLKAGLREVFHFLDRYRFLRCVNLEAAPTLVWNYGNQSDWTLLSKLPEIEKLQSYRENVGRIHSLKHISRMNIRDILMQSGRYSSIYIVDLGGLGLPKILEDYILYESEWYFHKTNL